MDLDGKDAYAEDKRREDTLVGCVEALEKSFHPAADVGDTGTVTSYDHNLRFANLSQNCTSR